MKSSVTCNLTNKKVTISTVNFYSKENLREYLLDTGKNGIADVSSKFKCTVDTYYPESLVSTINSFIWKFIKDHKDHIQEADRVSEFELNFTPNGNGVMFNFAYKYLYNNQDDYGWIYSEVNTSEQMLEATGGWTGSSTYTDPVDNVKLDITLGGVTKTVSIKGIGHKEYRT